MGSWTTAGGGGGSVVRNLRHGATRPATLRKRANMVCGGVCAEKLL